MGLVHSIRAVTMLGTEWPLLPKRSVYRCIVYVSPCPNSAVACFLRRTLNVDIPISEPDPENFQCRKHFKASCNREPQSQPYVSLTQSM